MGLLQAEHSDGQWTRFKFNSNHDADEGDMKLDTAELKGYSNAAGTVGTSHEVITLQDYCRTRKQVLMVICK